MRILLKLLFFSLLLALLVALGTEVAALRRKHRSAAVPLSATVVVRKSAAVPTLRKSVHPVAEQPR